jgi:hypothetical protein
MLRTRLAVASILLGGCTFNAQNPTVFHCSPAEPDCPAGTTCDTVRKVCVTNGTTREAGLDAPLSDRPQGAEQSRVDSRVDTRVDGRPRIDVIKVDHPVKVDYPVKADLKKPDLFKPDSRSPDTYNPCTAPVPPSTVKPNAIVSDLVGDDKTLNPLCVPYKTITAALNGTKPGWVVWVAPGGYSAEKFPLLVPDSVILVGDEANRGKGSAGSTSIKGYGMNSNGVKVSLIPVGPNAVVKGFDFMTAAGSNDVYGIDNADQPMTISSNTFSGEIGVNAYGLTACPNITSNTFINTYRGITSKCSGVKPALMVQGNSFATQSYNSIYSIAGSGSIIGNTFDGPSGGMPIQVDSDSPTIDGNTFGAGSGTLGFNPGAIRVYGGSPKIRNNGFKSGPCVYIDPGTTPDLGTALEAGKNDFGNITDVALFHGGVATIMAIGNAWATGSPCSYMKITSTGKVVWGTGSGQSCP